MSSPRICDECGMGAAPGRSRCWHHYYWHRLSATHHAERVSYPRILFIDIETAPNLVYTWGLFNQNIGVEQVEIPARMLCFTAKWAGDDEAMFYAEWKGSGQEWMIEAAHRLLDEADIVVHYYGSRFDVPHLNREFLQQRMVPPSPFKQVDLKLAVAKRFEFPSNKLAFVAAALNLPGKLEHEGFGLWKKVLAGDEDARARMEAYNRRDVALLEEVYEVLLPWIPGLPNRRLYNEGGGCPACGEDSLERKGHAYTKLSKFRQYQCAACGSWFRSSRREAGVNVQESILNA